MSEIKKSNVIVRFEVEHQIENLKEFQEAGHSVAAVRKRDAEGNLTQQPREWKGEEVHAFSLCDQSGQVAKTVNHYTGKSETFCRVVADTEQEAFYLMHDAILAQFWTLRQQTELATFHAEQLRKSTDQRTRLMNWMISNGHIAELQEMFGGSAFEEALREVLKAESDPELRKAVERLLEGRP